MIVAINLFVVFSNLDSLNLTNLINLFRESSYKKSPIKEHLKARKTKLSLLYTRKIR